MTTTLLSQIRFSRAAAVAALSVGLLLQACGEPAAPATNAPAKQPVSEAEPTPARPRAVQATTTTEWPGVEARLIRLERTGQMVQVEIELANTGGAPATIDNYSAEQATLIDEKSKVSVEPFSLHGHQPVATQNLTATLQPGQTAVVSATFPYVEEATAVTLDFPRIARFEGVGIENPRAFAPKK